MRPPSSVEWPLAAADSGLRESSRIWMPRKVTTKPAMSETVFVGLSVLNPWKRMREATMVAVEKQT